VTGIPLLEIPRRAWHAIRRRLRLVSYYSAARRRTRWTRLANGALVLALLLAAPAMLAAESLVERREVVREIRGIIVGGPDEALVARVHDESRSARLWRDEANPYGEWSVNVATVRRGWPAATSIGRSAAALEVVVFDEGRTRADADIAAGAPIRAAIGLALDVAGESALAAEVAAGPPPATATQRRWLAAIVGSLVWWAALYGAGLVVIGLLRLASMHAAGARHGRRAERRAANRCAVCDYDLTGLEYHARCPECGALIE
jgi:hypothetical protein